MISARMKARIVRVKTEEGKTGLFYATSPDLTGLLVAEPTLDALEREIPKAIADLYAASGQKVLVTSLDEQYENLKPWVTFPVEVARPALAEAKRDKTN